MYLACEKFLPMDLAHFGRFVGHKKTSSALLEKVRAVSRDPAQLMKNLRSLGIFSSVTAVERKVALAEAPSAVRMRIDAAGKRRVAVSLPNIFGGGEFLKIDWAGRGAASVTAGCPAFIRGSLLHLGAKAERETRSFDGKKVAIDSVELYSKAGCAAAALGAERVAKLLVLFARGETSFLGIRFWAKAGATRPIDDPSKAASRALPFARFVLSRVFSVGEGRFFADARLSAGRLFGPSSLAEKFFLGADLRGYRSMSISPVAQNTKVGGNSFAAVKTRMGVRVAGAELFAFADAGAASAHGISQCIQILHRFGDNNCLGKSVGLGLSLVGTQTISFVYAVPLTSNSEVERYSIGLDMEF